MTLLHVGYHKTGTTWLQEHVFTNADLGFVRYEPWTDIHASFVAVDPFAFDAESARARFKGLFDEASTRGLVPVISHEDLCGRELHVGMDARLIADRLHETFPDARVLIVIREQRDMLQSAYRARVARAGTQSIDRTWGPKADGPRARGRTLGYYEYDRLIRYYRGRFGAERVLALPYETLVRDPRAFVAQIASFVGIAKPMRVPDVRANVGLPAGLIAATRYVNAALRAVGLRSLTPGAHEESDVHVARQRVMRALARVTPESFSRRVEGRWRARIDEIVGDRFAESNRITSDLVGIDLGSLGYAVRRSTQIG